MLKIFGIPNCDTMKKARKWLSENNLDYEFHDYKKLGVPADRLDQWITQAGWETLLNRRGMMWRKLDQQTRDNIDETSARKLMLEIPSIIKRPVLVTDDGGLLVGFKETDYQALLQE